MPKRILTSFLLVFIVFSLASAAVQDDAERQRAFQLYKEGKFIEALPLFEKLAGRYPKDPQVFETYGLVVLGQTAYLKDAAARKEARKRGREILVEAQKLGADSALLKSMIEA